MVTLTSECILILFVLALSFKSSLSFSRNFFLRELRVSFRSLISPCRMLISSLLVLLLCNSCSKCSFSVSENITSMTKFNLIFNVFYNILPIYFDTSSIYLFERNECNSFQPNRCDSAFCFSSSLCTVFSCCSNCSCPLSRPSFWCCILFTESIPCLSISYKSRRQLQNFYKFLLLLLSFTVHSTI